MLIYLPSYSLQDELLKLEPILFCTIGLALLFSKDYYPRYHMVIFRILSPVFPSLLYSAFLSHLDRAHWHVHSSSSHLQTKKTNSSFIPYNWVTHIYKCCSTYLFSSQYSWWSFQWIPSYPGHSFKILQQFLLFFHWQPKPFRYLTKPCTI